MFENENRYIAKSVGGRIHLDVQIFIWQAIEWLKNEGEELDYLQVFNISSKWNKSYTKNSTFTRSSRI